MKPVLRTILYFLAAMVISAAVAVTITVHTIHNSYGDRVVMTQEEYAQLDEWLVLDEIARRIDEQHYGEEVPGRNCCRVP